MVDVGPASVRQHRAPPPLQRSLRTFTSTEDYQDYMQNRGRSTWPALTKLGDLLRAIFGRNT